MRCKKVPAKCQKVGCCTFFAPFFQSRHFSNVCGDFWHLFFSSFPSSTGKEIRDILKENMMPVLRCLGSCMFTKPCKSAVNCIFSCICASFGVIFLFAVLTPHGENLACHFTPKICSLYGNTVVRGLAHWNYSLARILKYLKNMVFGGILNSKINIL